MRAFGAHPGGRSGTPRLPPGHGLGIVPRAEHSSPTLWITVVVS